MSENNRADLAEANETARELANKVAPDWVPEARADGAVDLFGARAAKEAAEAAAHEAFLNREIDFECFGDRILVRRLAEEGETKIGSIVVPDQAKEKPLEADVLVVGPGYRNEHGPRIPLTVVVGDRVLISKWSGTEVKLDGETLLVLKEDELFGRRKAKVS